MNLIWRFLWTLFFSRYSSMMTLFDDCHTAFRVLPTDVDVLLHMNNGRYFSLMDLARINFMIRCNAFPQLAKNKIYPVIASEMIRFKKSLQLFQHFDIVTRLIGWDDKFFYQTQLFQRHGEVYALALIKARFLCKTSGPVNPVDILALIGVTQPSPPLPLWVYDWQQADEAFLKSTI